LLNDQQVAEIETLTLITKHKAGSRSRSIALAMLVLIAHAAIVSATHHHSVRPQAVTASADQSVASSHEDSGSAPDSNSDAHCLSCRLQRNLVSSVHAAPVLVESITQPILHETPRPDTTHSGSSLLLRGRAPPLA
jgi:hypothetical protein